MTVAELIERLKDLPQDVLVFICDDENGYDLANSVRLLEMEQRGSPAHTVLLWDGKVWNEVSSPPNVDFFSIVYQRVNGIILV